MQHLIFANVSGFEVEILFTTSPIDVDRVTALDVTNVAEAAKFLGAHGAAVLEGRHLDDEHEEIVEELLAVAGEERALGDWGDDAIIAARDAEALGL